MAEVGTTRVEQDPIDALPRVTTANIQLLTENTQRSPQSKNGQFTTSSMLTQIEKLRKLVKERDAENIKLKQDNLTLRQTEKKHLKDIHDMEVLNDDAPRIIQGLRNEINSLKGKLKDYYTHLTSDNRQIRHLNKDLLRYKEQILKYEKVIFARDLEDRESLTKQVEESSLRATEQERLARDALHRMDLMEKNHAGESRHLRSKIHSLELENDTYKEKCGKLEHTIREKEKEIASLSIYRFNALHRKSEGYCKTCAKRERDEQEQLKRKQIMEKLPNLSLPCIKLVSATSVEAVVDIPAMMKKVEEKLNTSYRQRQATHVVKEVTEAKPTLEQATSDPPVVQETAPAAEAVTAPAPAISKDIEYTSITMRCSSDPSFSTILEQVVLFAPDKQPSKKMLAVTDRIMTFVYLTEDQVYSDHAQVKPFTVSFKNLNSGKKYYFDTYASYEHIQGQHTILTEGLLVDALPNAPEKPVVRLTSGQVKEADIVINPVLSTQGESPVTRYNIYHSTDANMSEKYLIGQLDAETERLAHPDQTDFIFSFKEPQVLIQHYFQVSALNEMGEGIPSEPSDMCFIDTPPLQPTKPKVKRASANTVRVKCTVPNNGASPITHYLIQVFKVTESLVTETAEPIREPILTLTANVSQDHTSTSTPSNNIVTPHLLNYFIPDLELATKYKLQVVAVNTIGESQPSPESDILDLERMVPTPSDLPHFDITSPESVTFTFNDYKPDANGIVFIDDVQVVARRIYSSLEPDMHDMVVEMETVPIDQEQVILKGLARCQQYFFAFAYIGKSSTGLQIPCTPEPIVESRPKTPKVTSGQPLSNSRHGSLASVRGSRQSLNRSRPQLPSGSNLSLDQKVVNMHNGMPANHDDETPAQFIRKSNLKLSEIPSTHANLESDSETDQVKKERISNTQLATKTKSNIVGTRSTAKVNMKPQTKRPPLPHKPKKATV